MKLIETLFGKKQLPALSSVLVEEGQENRSLFLDSGALTHKGRVRDHNEDAFISLSALVSQEEEPLPMGLYIVADGMGGHEGGEQASTLAVRSVANWVLEKIYRPLLADTIRSAGQQPINQVLTEAAIAANSRINQECPDGGTTLTCAFVVGTNAFIVNVGDSRAYLISRNTIRQITTDHSLVNRLIELGQITSEEARTHPQRHVLYRALGRSGNLEVDTFLQSLPLHSSLLLCSDGLWEMVSSEAILNVINGAPSPQAACRQLIALANENGGQDNITAILVQVRN
jgi:serine/threonine protein phosphatase PrpC